MRQEIYTGPVIVDKDKRLKVYLKAKALIEEHGIEDHVIELSQPHCMGGATFVLTPKTELDKEYIGYRGFMDYERLCERIARISENTNQH